MDHYDDWVDITTLESSHEIQVQLANNGTTEFFRHRPLSVPGQDLNREWIPGLPVRTEISRR